MTLQRVSPVTHDHVDRTGWEFECDTCSWRSPIMKYVEGADRHAREHHASGVHDAGSDLRSHEPPRNSGEGAAVNGPTPLGEKDDADAPA